MNYILLRNLSLKKKIMKWALVKSLKVLLENYSAYLFLVFLGINLRKNTGCEDDKSCYGIL
jgi:hypothetical protein